MIVLELSWPLLIIIIIIIVRKYKQRQCDKVNTYSQNVGKKKITLLSAFECVIMTDGRTDERTGKSEEKQNSMYKIPQMTISFSFELNNKSAIIKDILCVYIFKQWTWKTMDGKDKKMKLKLILNCVVLINDFSMIIRQLLNKVMLSLSLCLFCSPAEFFSYSLNSQTKCINSKYEAHNDQSCTSIYIQFTHFMN